MVKNYTLFHSYQNGNFYLILVIENKWKYGYDSFNADSKKLFKDTIDS